MRIVHLVSSLGPTHSARHLSIVLPRLLELGDESVVLNFGTAQPFAESLQSKNIAVKAIRIGGPFDIRAIREVRQTLAELQPSVLHIWGNRAASLANLFASGSRTPTIVSDLAPTRSAIRFLIHRTRRRANLERDSEPVVEERSVIPATFESLGVPADSKLIANIGGFDANADPKAVLWSFDIIRHTDPKLHLVLLGDGPDCERIEGFSRTLSSYDYRVHFLGIRSDVHSILASATALLLTHRRGGATAAREAMTLGVPVVGTRNPQLSEIVSEGRTGFLSPPGDYLGLAQSLHRIFNEPALERSLKEHLQKAPSGKSVDDEVREWQAAYRTLFAK